jgi:hypothetical protein
MLSICNTNSPVQANFNTLKSKVEVASTEHTKASVDLPLEVIYEIAMHLASSGNRSAVIAALIHPACTKGALSTFYKDGIVLKISTKYDCVAYAERFGKLQHYPPIHTLRLLSPNSTSFYCSKPPTSLLSFWQIENGNDTKEDEEGMIYPRRGGNTMELHGDFDSPESKILAILLGQIDTLTLISPTLIYQLASRFNTVRELSIVELKYDGFLKTMKRIFQCLERVFFFYSSTDWDSPSATMLRLLMYNYSFMVEKLGIAIGPPSLSMYSNPATFIFVKVIKEIKEPWDGVTVKPMQRYDDGSLQTFRYYDVEWDEE